MEAMRALKRRLSDVVSRQMMADVRAGRTGPGGHTGAATGSRAAGSDPNAGSSDKSLPGPATSDPTPHSHPFSARADRLAWIGYPKGGRFGTDLNRDRLVAALGRVP